MMVIRSPTGWQPATTATMAEAVAPETPEIPAGFTPLQRGGGNWFASLGPCFVAPGDNGSKVLGLRIDARHINVQGVAHGGMLTTLADSALGMNIFIARSRKAAQAGGQAGGQVTVSLTADYLASVREGDWLQAHVHITRLGQRLAYANCDLRSGSRHVLRCSAVFAFVDRPAPPAAPATVPAPPGR